MKKCFRNASEKLKNARKMEPNYLIRNLGHNLAKHLSNKEKIKRIIDATQEAYDEASIRKEIIKNCMYKINF